MTGHGREARSAPRRAALALALLAFPALPIAGAGSASAAAPSMVLGRSMASVKLDDSLARLHQILGEPKAVHNVSNEIAGTERIDIYGRLAFGSFPSPEAEGRVLYMETTRRSIRTSSGLGVGTRKPRLERELPSLRCYRHLCSVVAGGGLQTIGKRVTSFRLRSGRVKVVSIGRVID